MASSVPNLQQPSNWVNQEVDHVLPTQGEEERVDHHPVSIWREQLPPRVVRTARRDSAGARESSHLETPPISRVALSRSREERETSGREMDWEQGQDDSRMKEEMRGDTMASCSEQRLQSFVRLESLVRYFKTYLILPSGPFRVHHP